MLCLTSRSHLSAGFSSWQRRALSRRERRTQGLRQWVGAQLGPQAHLKHTVCCWSAPNGAAGSIMPAEDLLCPEPPVGSRKELASLPRCPHVPWPGLALFLGAGVTDQSPFITSSTHLPPRGVRWGWPLPVGTRGTPSPICSPVPQGDVQLDGRATGVLLPTCLMLSPGSSFSPRSFLPGPSAPHLCALPSLYPCSPSGVPAGVTCALRSVLSRLCHSPAPQGGGCARPRNRQELCAAGAPGAALGLTHLCLNFSPSPLQRNRGVPASEGL